MVVADTWRQLFTLAGLAPFSFKSGNSSLTALGNSALFSPLDIEGELFLG